MFDLAGPNPKRKGTKRTVSSCMRVTANDGHARLSVPKFRADDVNDTLMNVVEIVEPNSKFLAVVAKCIYLLFGDGICDREIAIIGRDIVIGGRNGKAGASYGSSGDSQTFECLGTSHFMHQMKIDVQNGLLARFTKDIVVIPDLLEHRARRGSDKGHRNRILEGWRKFL